MAPKKQTKRPRPAMAAAKDIAVSKRRRYLEGISDGTSNIYPDPFPKISSYTKKVIGVRAGSATNESYVFSETASVDEMIR
jgi:hypothetical protein